MVSLKVISYMGFVCSKEICFESLQPSASKDKFRRTKQSHFFKDFMEEKKIVTPLVLLSESKET